MWPNKRLRALEDQNEILARGLAAYEDRFRALKAEWLDWEAKLVRLYQRTIMATRKRDERDEQDKAAEQNGGAPTGNPRTMDKAELRRLANTLRGAK